MLDISTRINALIAYLFLGPLLLAAKTGTPLAHPYVRGHAKRASTIILLGLICFIVYRYIRAYLTFSMFGISIGLVVLTLIVSITLLFLLTGAYRAYSGTDANDSNWSIFSIPKAETTEWNYSEEEKIRIIASFIPFIGMIIASRNNNKEIQIGSRLSSIVLSIILIGNIFFSGNNTTLMSMILFLYICLIVATTVQLFGFSRFFAFSFYEKIPSYIEFDAYIKASIINAYNFLRIAFWGSKQSNFREIYEGILQKNNVQQEPTTKYPLPSWIIAIPVINIITVPSLTKVQYREYTKLILQWIGLTLLTGAVIYKYSLGSQIGLFLFFPIISLVLASEKNLLARAPIVSIMLDLYSFFSQSKEKIDEIEKNGQERVEYTYSIENTEVK